MENQPDTEVWELLLRTHAALVPMLSERVETAAGIALSWYDVLLELNRSADGRLRMTELGERVVLSRSHVSRIVDQMTAAGLVERISDPGDGRAWQATPTPRGRRAFRKAAAVYLEAIEEHFSQHLSDRERSAMTDGLRRVLVAAAQR